MPEQTGKADGRSGKMNEAQQDSTRDPNQDPVHQLPRTRPGGQTDSATGEKPGGGYGHPQPIEK